MEGLSVRVRNPFALRESLQIALEVAWPDLPPEQVALLRKLVSGLPTQVTPTDLALRRAERTGLLSCIAHFRQRRTWYWLRDDLGEAILGVERQLRNQ